MKMLGLGNMLVEFPSTFQTMYFVRTMSTSACDGAEEQDADCSEVVRGAVKARSADGLEMLVFVSFQWRLQPQSLKPLYEILGDDLYKDEFVRFARAAIVEGCSKFPADMYFTNRTVIKAEMMDRLGFSFHKPERGLQVEIKDVQLREVDLPDAFDDEIANTQEQMQEVEVAVAEREEQRIAMEREILVAKEKVQQIVQEATGQAEKVRLENEAFVSQMLNFQKRQALANGKILQTFENDEDPFGKLFEMMKIRAIQDHSNSKLLINM